MTYSSIYRTIVLLLIVAVFSITFVQAQESANVVDNLRKIAKNEFAFPLVQTKLLTSQNKEIEQSEKIDENEKIEQSEKIDENEKRFSKTIASPDYPIEPKMSYKYQEKNKPSNREWGVYAGSFTFHKDLRGESQKAPVVLFGLRYAWTTKNNPKHRLRYYMDFNPLIIINYRNRRPIQTSPTETTIVGERETAVGIGFTPVGLQFNWRNSRKIQPYIAGGFGFAVFNKKFPDNRSPLQPDKIGNRFQLMPEFGAGIEYRKSETRSYFFGYKYHHMSNGYTAPLNVGYNTNMVYVGMYFRSTK
ncbi:MAG: acyloxyacyl hydrolase [Aridibacter sp.]